MTIQTPPDLAASLDAVLADLITVHHELLELVREHRVAISRNDAAAIQECLSRQGMLGVRIAALEEARSKAIREITGNPRSGMAEVLAKLRQGEGSALAARADQLRCVLMEVQRQNGIVRAATQSLLAHIDSLMQQVARALSKAGTYGRKGRIEGGPVACGVDMVH